MEQKQKNPENSNVTNIDNTQESTNKDPLSSFAPGGNEDITQKVKNLAGMTGMNIPNMNQVQDTEKMKKELTDKIIKGVSEGKDLDSITNDLLSNMPEGEQKNKIKESMKPMLEQSIQQIKDSSFSQEKIQEKIQEMLIKVTQENKSVEEVIDEFISTIPDDPNIDKKKIKEDLTGMMNQAVNAYKQNSSSVEQKFSPSNNLTQNDPWKHKTDSMKCKTCMWYVEKTSDNNNKKVGRCRRHAPTMNGYPVVFENDWCGDHKLDETKLI